MLASFVTGQDGVLNKQTIQLSGEKFGGIEEVAVVRANGAMETVVLSPPLGVTAALSEASRQLEENLEGDTTVLCFEAKRIEFDTQSQTSVTETPGTVFIGDPDSTPCKLIVLTGQVDVITTITGMSTHFYQLQVHLDADWSCALKLTSFAFDVFEKEATLVWNSIPEAKYSIEWSRDLRDWQVLEQDIPSQGSSTTRNGLAPLRSADLYFRVRLQIDSLPDPNP